MLGLSKVTKQIRYDLAPREEQTEKGVKLPSNASKKGESSYDRGRGKNPSNARACVNCSEHAGCCFCNEFLFGVNRDTDPLHIE